jgi:hypothetical protein
MVTLCSKQFCVPVDNFLVPSQGTENFVLVPLGTEDKKAKTKSVILADLKENIKDIYLG